MNLIGLLLAAGRGRRMGGNKQFHIVTTPDGDKPLVAAAYDTIARACDRVFVVLGHRADEVATVLAPRKFEIITADPDVPMIESILAGLRAINSRGATLAVHSILLQLGDHPALTPNTLDKLLAIAQQHPDKAIMPTYQGNGGHPVLIPTAIAAQILTIPCPDGLRQFWNDHPELCVRLEVDDPGVVSNINLV
jgi:molybdenum cofactor cytidylyltransferase